MVPARWFTSLIYLNSCGYPILMVHKTTNIELLLLSSDSQLQKPRVGTIWILSNTVRDNLIHHGNMNIQYIKSIRKPFSLDCSIYTFYSTCCTFCIYFSIHLIPTYIHRVKKILSWYVLHISIRCLFETQILSKPYSI